ncbi:MAG: NFACT family protein [Peptococcaceae bacterium]|nr:NFACT family protein [Peptococcaceae bacterium]
MSLDSLTLHHLIRELAPQLVDARVDRIHQPEKDEVHLHLRPKHLSGERFPGPIRLLLNAGSTSARLHLIQGSKPNPTSPPMFCMILRKHLEGARLLNIYQKDLDRIVILIFQNYNERGDLQEYHLTLEIMGKHSNLILINPLTGAVLDGIRRYSHALSRHREILPGRPYISPPTQQKTLPTDETTWIETLLSRTVLELPIVGALLKTFTGMSPELSRELAARAGLNEDTPLDHCGQIDLSRLYQTYAELLLHRDTTPMAPTLYYPANPKAHWSHVPSYTPSYADTLSVTQVTPTAFTFTPYTQYADHHPQRISTLNEALSLYYETRSLSNKKEASRGSLRRIVQDACAHTGKKISIYQDAIDKATQTLPAQKLGELLMANIYRIPPKATEITVDDYTQTDPAPQTDTPAGCQLTIPLDPQLTPVANAQLYYRRYNKAKAAIEKTRPLLETVQSEYAYLQSLLISIELAQTPQEMAEIHTELIEQKYIASKTSGHPKTSSETRKTSRKTANRQQLAAKTSGKTSASNAKPKTRSPKTPSTPPSRPHQYLSSTGHIIIVGRNNKQNDRMTWREAHSHDMWLHVKNIPGSHVIVPLNETEEFPDDATLLEAAALAIHFSQAAHSSHVPVDYTHVAQIKKPNAAKPGMVVYDRNWTLFLTPDPAVISTLLETEDRHPAP